MAFGIAGTVNIKTRPRQIHISSVVGLRCVINYDTRLSFERGDGVYMVDCGNGFVPGQASILRRLDNNPAFRTRRFGDANSDERKMSMVSRAIGAEVNRVVTLRQTFWILDSDRLPGFAAIHRDIVITPSARSGRATVLKRSRDNVGGILRIDGDRDFSRVDCVGFSYS